MPKNLIPKSKAKTAYGLLSEVRALILAEPLRYDQGTWIERKDNPRRNFDGDICEAPKSYPACGTVGCVAGWVATLTRKETWAYDETEGIAQIKLGLNDEQAIMLFDCDAVRHTIEPQTIQHAKAGARHIQRFQKKHAAQLKAKKL